MNGPRRRLAGWWLGLLFLGWSLSLPAHDGPRVLLLHSYHAGMAWVEEIEHAVNQSLRETFPDLELFIEYMDTKRIPYTPEYARNLREMLRFKYGDQVPGFSLIFACDNNAFTFLKRHRDELFPDTPVVFCGVNDFQPRMLDGFPRVTGIAEHIDAAATVRHMRAMFPQTREIAVITDALPTGLAWRAAIREQLASLDIPVRFLPPVPMAQLQAQVRALPRDTLLLLGAYFRDPDEVFFSPSESTQLITQVSPVPVYGLLDFQLGHGVVGGKMLSGSRQGDLMARLGGAVLQGTDVAKLPVVRTGTNRFLFDARQLRRWRVTESGLPAEAEIRFQPRRFYREYPLITLAFGVILGLILLLLLVAGRFNRRLEHRVAARTADLRAEIQQRKHTEFTLRETRKRLQNAQHIAKIGNWEWNPTTNATWWSAEVYAMLGLSDADTPPDYDVYLAHVHPADRALVQRALRLAIHEGEEISLVYRLIGRDGVARHIHGRGLPPLDGTLQGTMQDISETQRMALALRESEQRLRAVADQAPLLIGWVDAEQRYQFANARHQEWLGHPPETTTGRTMADTLGAFHYDQLKPFLEQALFGHPARFEMQLQCVDAPRRVVQVLLTPQTSDDSRVNGVLVVMEDISRQREMEQALRDSREHYRALFEQNQAVALLIDSATGAVRDANRAAESFYGYPLQKLKSMRIADINTLSPLEVQLEMERARRQQRNHFRFKHRLASGEARDVEVHSGPVMVRGERLLFSIIHDVTQRRLAEEAERQSREKLRESEEKYRTLFELFPVGLTMSDPEGNIIEVNPYSETLLGLAPRAHLQRALADPQWDAYYPNGEPMPVEAYPAVRALRDQQSVHDQEMGVRGSGGEWTWLMVSAVPVPLEQYGVAVAYFDITKRVRAERALRESQRQLHEAKQLAEAANLAKSRFLASMSHELRTPLNAILGYAQVLLRREPLAAQDREALQAIHRSGDYLLLLINDVLDLSKIEAEHLQLHITEIELAPLLAELEEMFRLRAEQKSLTFLRQATTPLPARVTLDGIRLRQVLINLLGNALKFTQQGTVRFAVSHAEGQLVFLVEDSGPGIAASERDRVFQPFEQAGAVDQQSEGTGLGLAISRKLVELMGGALTLDSEPGQGCRFTVSIPVTASATTVPPVATETNHPRATPSPSPPPLPPSLAKTLRELAREGNIPGIHQWIARNRKNFPAHAPTWARVQTLAEALEDETLAELAASWLEGE